MRERKAFNSRERELEYEWPDRLVSILTGLFIGKLNPNSEHVTSLNCVIVMFVPFLPAMELAYASAVKEIAHGGRTLQEQFI